MRRADLRWQVLVMVALLHAGLFLGLQLQLWRRPQPPAATPVLQWVTLPPLPSPPARPREQDVPRPVPVARATRPTTTMPSVTPPPSTLRLVEAPARPAEPPASAASAPKGSVLDSPASRQALRALGQRPLLAERTANAMGDEVQRSDGALGQDVQRAAKGDCLHGDFAGGGMGLLSLPALAVAAARGQCAR